MAFVNMDLGKIDNEKSMKLSTSMYGTQITRSPEEIISEVEQEVKYIVSVPTTDLTMRQQQLELSMSCQHMLGLFQELLNRDKYLLERLKHSEEERFNK